MSVARTGALPNSYKFYTIAVNRFENRRLEGLVFHERREDAVVFKSLTQMACVLNLRFDENQYPMKSCLLYTSYADEAPISVTNFLKLAGEGFYDGLTFHRIITGFMIQGGDPLGTGMGGSDQRIKGEFAANGV